jgi:peptide/nickel transport system substrate-binding protein
MHLSTNPASLRAVTSHAASLYVCAGLVAALTGVACARSEPVAPEGTPTLRVGFGVGGTAREAGLNVLIQLFSTEPLVSLSLEGRPEAQLADSWRWEDDARTLRLTLRPGVTFHNGDPVTIEDIKRTLTARVASARTSATSRGFQHVDSIETPDPSTIVLRLSRPDSFLLNSLSVTAITTGDGDVGTGPFRLVSRGQTVRFERFDGYHRGPSGLEAIEIHTYDTPRGAWAAMMRGDVDLVQEVTRDSVQFLQGASDVTTYDSLRTYYIPLVFNMRHPILRNVEVRRAINQAIDREGIVRSAMREHGRVADDPIWPFHWTYSAAARRYTHNQEAAKLRLDAAGLPVRPNRAPGAMTSRFRFTCVFWNEDPLFERIALMLQRQLFEIGIDMVLEPLPARQLEERIAGGSFDAFLFQLNSGRGFDWTYAFWHSPEPGVRSMQTSGYTGVDDALERLRAARSDAETRVAVADLQQRYYEDPPAAFIAWLETTRAINSRFSLGDVNPNDLFANVWQWRAAGAPKADN